uniref:Uroporphyrinogen decarboxylase n=1 Tax=Compsopogon caeruleus TaxID=31354 RepID=A0A7S1TFJ8_9RHOD
MGFVGGFGLVSSESGRFEHATRGRVHHRRGGVLRMMESSVGVGSESRMAASAMPSDNDRSDPLLVRAARGEEVERPPVWMMRQAGRYMKVYQDLAKEHPSFRERSENVELSTEISLQPWRAFRPDGVILFSDILTPLPGMGVGFDIPDRGPVISPALRTVRDIARVTELDPETATPFVGETLRNLRREVGNEAAVLGFVGAPYTLATYCIEGGTSKSYSTIKRMAFSEPETLHKLLNKFATNIANYAQYQIENGAQAVQMFDSWAGQLSPQDYDVFAGPYQKKVIDVVKAKYPSVPLILYISQSSALLERMASTGVDVVSVDWTVDMEDARTRLGQKVKVQGNMDPACLLGTQDFIGERIRDTIEKAGRTGHIMNLGHGVLPNTPEENVAHYFKVVQSWKW